MRLTFWQHQTTKHALMLHTAKLLHQGNMGAAEWFARLYIAQYQLSVRECTPPRATSPYLNRPIRSEGEALKDRLRYHVTGAIERGEAEAIEERR